MERLDLCGNHLRKLEEPISFMFLKELDLGDNHLEVWVFYFSSNMIFRAFQAILFRHFENWYSRIINWMNYLIYFNPQSYKWVWLICNTIFFHLTLVCQTWWQSNSFIVRYFKKDTYIATGKMNIFFEIKRNEFRSFQFAII